MIRNDLRSSPHKSFLKAYRLFEASPMVTFPIELALALSIPAERSASAMPYSCTPPPAYYWSAELTEESDFLSLVADDPTVVSKIR
jgi:hypothetical protein